MLFILHVRCHSDLYSSLICRDSRLWDVATGFCLTTLVPLAGNAAMGGAAGVTPVASVKFAPSSSLLLACTLDNTIRLWDVVNARVVKSFTGHVNQQFATKAGFTRPRHMLPGLACKEDADWAPHVVISETGQPLSARNSSRAGQDMREESQVYITPAEADAIATRHVASEERRKARKGLPEIFVVCGAEDSKLWIWDLQTKEALQTIPGHSDVIVALAVHPTQPIIATGSMEHDPSIRLWMDVSDDG